MGLDLLSTYSYLANLRLSKSYENLNKQKLFQNEIIWIVLIYILAVYMNDSHDYSTYDFQSQDIQAFVVH